MSVIDLIVVVVGVIIVGIIVIVGRIVRGREVVVVIKCSLIFISIRKLIRVSQ